VLKWSRGRREQPAVVQGTIEIGRPWARAGGRLPGFLVGGFLTIANRGAESDRLAGAGSPASGGAAELQGIKVVGSVIQMVPLAHGVVIQAGSTIELKPRGYHLLLHGFKTAPSVGSRLPVTLTFERAGTVEVELVVEPPGPVGDAAFDE